MRSRIRCNPLLAIGVACVVAGCSAGSPGDATNGQVVGAGDHASTESATPARPATLRPAPGSGPGFGSAFADLPDHGDLVAYPRERVARRAGAATWHRVDVSEDHALRAIGGELSITAPSGQLLRFRYERYVEHASGDWTWHGRSIADPSQDAVLTFGSEAVHGDIASASGAPLEIAMRDGASWMVEHEPALIDTPSMQAASAQPLENSAPATIDVLVGYTAGFARGWGGTPDDVAPVLTRLHFLVERANASFASRNVAARLRLLDAMSLGDSARSDGLYGARDRSGADLAVLVGAAGTASGTQCGGASTSADADARPRVDEILVVFDDVGGTCRRLALAGQLDKLLQDVAPATVAARRSAVRPGGRPRNDFDGDGKSDLLWHNWDTGQNLVWLSADARTPRSVGSAVGWQLVGTGDLNGDGTTDIFWRSRDDEGRNVSWLDGDRSRILPMGKLGRGTYWQASTPHGDFNGDGRSDIVWRRSDRTAFWWSPDGTQVWEASGRVGNGWEIAGVGDFDGDGQDDLVWHFFGKNAIWRSGNNRTQLAVADMSPSHRLAAIGDFDGDGRDDFFWRDPESGASEIWPGADASAKQSVARVHADWSVGATGDFDGDGRADLAWRNFTTGANALWPAANPAMSRPLGVVRPDQTWQMIYGL